MINNITNRMKIILLVLIICGIAFGATLTNVPLPRSALGKAVPNLRIINGTEVFPHSIPYQAYIIAYGDNETKSCSGTLITPNFVVTAAHCLKGAVFAQVKLGRHNISELEWGIIEVNSRNIFIHEQFNAEYLDNDIGLIELDGFVSPSSTIGYVRMPSRQEEPDPLIDQIGRVSGWGAPFSEADNGSEVLRLAYGLIISNDKCSDIYGGIAENQLCLEGLQGHVVCNGDTGGPLIVNERLEGIVSYGIQDCRPDYPAVFIRIRSHLQWIEEHSDWRSP